MLRPALKRARMRWRHVFETGEPRSARHRHPDEDKGTILFVETKAFPIRDSTGAVKSVIETINNITKASP